MENIFFHPEPPALILVCAKIHTQVSTSGSSDRFTDIQILSEQECIDLQRWTASRSYLIQNCVPRSELWFKKFIFSDRAPRALYNTATCPKSSPPRGIIINVSAYKSAYIQDRSFRLSFYSLSNCTAIK